MFPKPGRRSKRKPNPGHPYLGWLKEQSCCACGAGAPTEAAHVRGPVSLKTGLLLARRAEEAYLSAVPLCVPCHRTGDRSLHELGESGFSLAVFNARDALARLAHAYLARYALSRREIK